jgi:hypothetical protein
MRAAIAAALLAASTAGAQDTPKPAPAKPLAGFGWFAELAGSCWAGTRTDGRTTDTQCYLAQYEKLMRGTVKVTVAGNDKPVFEGDAVFALDPNDAKKAVYSQWGSGGVYATGEITFEGDKLVFHSRQLDGKPAPMRHVWRRTGPDSFRVTREGEKDSSWAEVFSVDYKRIPGK